MKILKIKDGFTTNSSGSYEWLPLGASNTQTKSATSQNIDITQSQFIPAGSGKEQPIDWLILPLSVIAGAIAVSLIVKEIIKTVKKGNKKQNKK